MAELGKILYIYIFIQIVEKNFFSKIEKHIFIFFHIIHRNVFILDMKFIKTYFLLKPYIDICKFHHSSQLSQQKLTKLTNLLRRSSYPFVDFVEISFVDLTSLD
jgi:hypothetical protein